MFATSCTGSVRCLAVTLGSPQLLGCCVHGHAPPGGLHSSMIHILSLRCQLFWQTHWQCHISTRGSWHPCKETHDGQN